MRIAVIADVHGNRPALDAVLLHLGRRGGADRIVNLGDCASGPLWPAETMERLAALDAVTVRGNHDRQVATLAPDAMIASDRFACDALAPGQRRWLGALPITAIVTPGVLVCHATPARDDAYLLETVRDGKLVRDEAAAIVRRLDGAGPARVVLCGHSHRPDRVRLVDGTLILNPGSVGCPAYADPAEPAHVSEVGSPHARYALLDLAAEAGSDRVEAEFFAVPYASEDAAARAEANGRPDWAHALRTGFMPA